MNRRPSREKRGADPSAPDVSVSKPLILAPAGNKAAFLAALAAGADAVYCGLKQFSARMQAKNFDFEALSALTALAHEEGTQVYITLNTLLKPDELQAAAGLIRRLSQEVKPDGLIIQDLAFITLARQVGFGGELHLSTLANVTFPKALKTIHGGLGVHRVVIARELSIDEIKAMAQACPQGMQLETFIHGALCYAVSGRCYWSSYLGGKSGLRGHCVQPCRRQYRQGAQPRRFFSCRDFSIDVLVKVLATVAPVRTWKIEGRKKSPHYVYYTVTAYRLLRDRHNDPQAKRDALDLLSQALGREGSHYGFLSQRPRNPLDHDDRTGSGLFLGTIQGAAKNPYFNPRQALLPGDVLRIGYEDEPWHAIVRVGRHVPKKGKFHLKSSARKTAPKGTSVFLKDRREAALEQMIRDLESRMPPASKKHIPLTDKGVRLPKGFRPLKKGVRSLSVFRQWRGSGERLDCGLWLSSENVKQIPKPRFARIWWWLPPVIWPEAEQGIAELIRHALHQGAKRFVLNAPWQTAFFPDSRLPELWAGPFCNIANGLAVDVLKDMGFSGVIASPELGRSDYLALPRQSPLPLGVVISGHWPLCISRILSPALNADAPFASPRGEQAMVRKFDDNYWIYPNWQLDLTQQQTTLQKAGFTLFIHMEESFNEKKDFRKRPGLWNWHLGLK